MYGKKYLPKGAFAEYTYELIVTDFGQLVFQTMTSSLLVSFDGSDQFLSFIIWHGNNRLSGFDVFENGFRMLYHIIGQDP